MNLIHPTQEYRGVATKYAENCSAKDMKGTAAMIYLSLGDVARDKMLSFAEFVMQLNLFQPFDNKIK